MTQYAKDNGEFLTPRDFTQTFGRQDQITLDLINSCRDIYKDRQGEYVYDASGFDVNGHVIYTRRNIVTNKHTGVITTRAN